MKTLLTFSALGFVGFALVAHAQPPEHSTYRTGAETADDLWQHDLAATPEMWFYLQERMRNDDPQVVLRRKAELKAQQRRQRIAARKALGVSTSRPNVRDTVFGGYYARSYPYWRSRAAYAWWNDRTAPSSSAARR
ncbi:MAG: hypothetical protein DWQ31_14350 [Planctomycetota bacterium]|nr:MAG: hypothetical protein DWQ31_14350 [Planctomycetota bacterium]REJ94550.1 MAG: hypothetical protein DWQ35_08055 [Planctomycetota bacterium]REK18588.1 MAG: hypothetical protein DWQ42_19415 [Planctomycetota bacterium]REK37484.1 MAG: hypothetical protein DWQ46_21895 [Planctomycetota bacterium]